MKIRAARLFVSNCNFNVFRKFMSILSDVKNIIVNVLQLQGGVASLEDNAPLLGAIPEFDSMAVISVIAALEEQFDFDVDDDEIDADIFETVGTLVTFVEGKV